METSITHSYNIFYVYPTHMNYYGDQLLQLTHIFRMLLSQSQGHSQIDSSRCGIHTRIDD